MYTDDNAEPPVRAMALHALHYCERLFYLEEVEEIRLADASVYAGRALHEEMRSGEGVHETRSWEIGSESLGLVGRVDAVRHAQGEWIPVEIKRGRAKREGSTPTAWPSDAIQVAAYALLLEEELGQPVSEARIRYIRDQVTVKVAIDDVLRAEVAQSVKRARELRGAMERPPVAPNERLCVRCSLAPVCLPEEERLAQDGSWVPARLFPQRRAGKVLHILDHQARVGRSGSTLTISTGDESRRCPIHEIDAVVIHGYAQVTTQAIHLCAAHEVGLHWLTPGGRYAAGLALGAGPVQRRLRQYQALSNPALRMELARRLVLAKVEGQLRYLLRATRGSEELRSRISDSLRDIRTGLTTVAQSTDPDTVRGGEGMAGRAYFDALPHLLSDRVPSEMVPVGRSRRPPRDRFNALLSFGYALLYQSILRAVLATGLEPSLGFFHTPRSSAHPLVLDLMELFRVPVWDMALVGSINRNQWDTTADFEVTKLRVWLSSSGRAKAISLFEQRVQDKWKHPVIGYSLTYERAMELEARLLEKEWTGQPGLFARARIR